VLYKYWTSNIAFFKMVGTEPKYVQMCRTLFLAYSLLAFDVLLSVTAIVVSASRPLKAENMANIIGLPVALVALIIWTIFGVVAVNLNVLARALYCPCLRGRS